MLKPSFLLWLKAIFVVGLSVDFLLALSGRYPLDVHLPLWFRGTWNLAVILAAIRIETKPEGGYILKVHPGIQFLLATIVVLAALPDLFYRWPQALVAAVIYWQGFVWAWSSLQSALGRRR